MTEIGIVGAGVAAAAATFVLDSAHHDTTVTVLEKSGGVCGRAATRRHEELTYDYGANYVKDDDERVVDLLTDTLDTEGLSDIPEPIYTFDADGTVSEGRDSDSRKWTYRQGLTQIAKRLFDQTDATVHRRTRVEELRHRDDKWTAIDTDGAEWGPFDILLMSPPAPQTAALLQNTMWDSPVRETLIEAVEGVEYRTIWSAVLRYEFEVDVPYYGLVNPGKDHEIGWISREECKPGHVPDGETLFVVQPNQEWSVTHYDDDPEANVAALAEYAAEIIGDDRLQTPVWSDHQGWRYALPESGVDTGPLDSAEREGLYCLGDWVTGEARVHAALSNGLNVGEGIVNAQ
ncbi:NAD(P)/FAD-dependent oxidoreductase [Halovenus rubra]|uniref:NAD(P)/FAD-dependent oxidoreductase n=2 Tax=Halovenus rubra TaxID=869890 RepID=A0ABD5X5Z8_9EURY|nr:FAD-dependent oxidoreductase [Halovenus rubra]